MTLAGTAIEHVARSRDRYASLGVGMVVGLVILLQLFMGQDIGLANNGDAERLFCRFEMAVPDRGGLTFELIAESKVPCLQDAEKNAWTYPTSVEPVIRLAIWVDDVIGSSEVFDIRLLGVIWALVFGVIAGAAVLVLPGRLWMRVVLVLLTFAFWVDVGFVTYLTSYFSDSAMFAGSAALLVVVAHHGKLESHRVWHYAVYVGVVLFAITSKPLLLFALLPASLVLLVMPWLTGRLAWRTMVLPVVSVLVMFAGAAHYLGSDGRNYADINEYNSLFFGVLAESEDPAADLAEMGLPVSVASYAGKHFFWPDGNARDHPDYRQLQEKLTRGVQLEFLIRHPDRLATMVKTTIEAMPDFRVPYIGNYDNSATSVWDVRLAERWDPMTKLLQATRGGIALWLPAIWLLAVGLGTAAALRWRDDPTRRSLGLLSALIGTTALLTVVAVPIGDGYMELPKHTVLVVWISAPLLVATAASIVYGARVGVGRFLRPELPAEDAEVTVDVLE